MLKLEIRGENGQRWRLQRYDHKQAAFAPPQNTPALHATPELKQPKSGTWRSLHAYEARTLQARNLSSFRGLNLRRKKKQSSEKFEG